MGDARDNAKKKKAGEKKAAKAAKSPVKAAPADPPQKSGKK